MPTYKITLEDYTPKVKRDIRGLKGYRDGITSAKNITALNNMAKQQYT